MKGELQEQSGSGRKRSAAARQGETTKLAGANRCRRKFLRFFPRGFKDEKYVAWERGYKWEAHLRWESMLGRTAFRELLRGEEFVEIGARALRTLSQTNLLFSFESMALRDALRNRRGARPFAEGLYEFIYGPGGPEKKFERWCDVVASLPKKQSRVFTHPVVTVFGFVARPDIHIFMKPVVTRTAAERYGLDLHYKSRPAWETYSSLLEFASVLNRDLADLRPRDMIDIQSFIWVNGSGEYGE